ncbi:MAG: hypothetical protein Kow0092_13470 [Deferrisomatales bacterium]
MESRSGRPRGPVRKTEGQADDPCKTPSARGHEAEARRGFEIPPSERLRYRTRSFTESGVIGTRPFVAACASRFEAAFGTRREKKPQPVEGIAGLCALKRLRALGRTAFLPPTRPFLSGRA